MRQSGTGDSVREKDISKGKDVQRTFHQRQPRACRSIRSVAALSTLLLLFPIVSTLDAAPPVSEALVRIGDQTIFTIHTGLGNIDPATRAEAIEARLARLAQAPTSTNQRITVEDHEHTSYVVTPDEVLFVVTESEATAAGQPRQTLAEAQAEIIREALLASQDAPTHLEPVPSMTLRDILWIGVATALLIFLAVALRVIYPQLLQAFECWRGTHFRAISFRGLELISADHLTNGLLLLVKFFRIVIAVLALYLYIHVVLGLFPWTRDFESTILHVLAAPLEHSVTLRAILIDLSIGMLLTLIATGIFLALLKVIQQLFPRILNAVSRWRQGRLLSLKIQRIELLSAEQITAGILGFLRVVRLLAIVFLSYFYATSILGFFPWTRGLSVALLGYFVAPIKTIGMAFASALPDIIAIVIIVFVAHYILMLIQLFFRAMERGAINFPGFHRDWAKPTYGIVRFLVIVLAAIACFPYFPGSQSEGFRGISVFLGLLITFGSAAAIGNMVAGVVLTYMRPFQLTDRVKIADTVGDVTEKTLLVTRIRTIKNVDITIPNSLILGAHIINYSSASMTPPPLILHMAMTIGYDVPWRTVHDLLKRAAVATTNVLSDPEPFVLQTALNDFYVTYELNVYTGAPNKMAVTYSELLQNIQDTFNEAGVEIMSPHYSQIRDGNKTAIPDQYLPKGYQAPGLRFEGSGNWFNKRNDPSAPKENPGS
ncbi:MAG: mechanosensitive ion channel domain-containing protein [Nitrospirota bacterium]